jgi:hypothetical protein
MRCRAQKQKRREFFYLDLAALVGPGILVPGSTEVILHVFLFALLARTALARRKIIVLFVTSRRLLAALAVLALVLVGATHVLPVEVIVSHSVVCHFYLTSRCTMVN